MGEQGGSLCRTRKEQPKDAPRDEGSGRRCKSVGVFRTTDGGRTWARIATAPYSPSERAYKFTVVDVRRNAYYQMRFSGDASYRAANSNAVPIRSY